MQITYEAYDRLQEELENIPNQKPAWLPTEDELTNYASQDPERLLEFLLWLTFTVDAPTTAEGQNRLRAINRFLYEKIIFPD